MNTVTYAELPDDIKRRWKEEHVAKVMTQTSAKGHLEYVIVPKDPKQYVEWWAQRKNLEYITASLPPDSWWWAGHYGAGRPPWAE